MMWDFFDFIAPWFFGFFIGYAVARKTNQPNETMRELSRKK